MEKETQSQTDLQNQKQNVSLSRGRSETRETTTGLHTSSVIPDFSSVCPMRDVSQVIWPYESAMVAPALAASTVRPAKIFYKNIPQTLAHLISHEQHCFEGQLPNTIEHYLVPVPTQSQLRVQPNNNNTLTSISYSCNYQTQVY